MGKHCDIIKPSKERKCFYEHDKFKKIAQNDPAGLCGFRGGKRRTIENWESSESCPDHVYGLLLEKIKGLSVTVVVAAVGDEYTRPIKVSAASRLDRDAAAAELATEFKRTTGRDLTPANAARFIAKHGRQRHVCRDLFNSRHR